MRYITYLVNGKIVDQVRVRLPKTDIGAVSNYIPQFEEMIIDLDTMLRKNGLIDDTVEIAVTYDI